MQVVVYTKCPVVSLGVRGISMNDACSWEFFKRCSHVGLVNWPETRSVAIVPIGKDNRFRFRSYKLINTKCAEKFVRRSGAFIKESFQDRDCFGEYIPFWNCLHNVVLLDLSHEIEPHLKEVWAQRAAQQAEAQARKLAEGNARLCKLMEEAGL